MPRLGITWDVRSLAGALVLAASACDRGSHTSGATASPSKSEVAAEASEIDCPRCEAPIKSGSLEAAAIDELSGLVAATKEPDVFFVHNDSGDTARFFAVRSNGALVGTFNVSGAGAVDWEDVARGPCNPGASATCLYFGDIGDNDESRGEYAVYRVPEPEDLPHPGRPAIVRQVAATALRFTYPDGKHNAETLLVHPSTGVITVVTKRRRGASGVYEMPMPLRPGTRVTVAKVGEVSPPDGINLITAGDVDPEAKGVLLRTYTSVFYYPMAKNQTVGEALTNPACTLPSPVEPQGEAIGFLPSGGGYVTSSEGKHADIHVVHCTMGAPSAEPERR